jgi:hypothetical protein
MMFVVQQSSNYQAMKTLAKIAMIVLMSAGAWMMPQKAAAQFPGITFQVFYDQLSPYGAWVYDPDNGYVWIPDEGAGFYPYGSGGHWVFTVFGWTWVSDYPWGWAPFHYGRWSLDPYYGWIWIPGNEWGPAWVTWRRCNDYYGWAPLGPGMTLQMTFGPHFFIPDDRWLFVRDRDFDRYDLDRHFIGRRENHDMIRNSTAIKNTRMDNTRNVTYATGPNEKEVGLRTGRDIKPMPVKEYTQPGKTVVGKDQVGIYRPPVSKEEVNGRKPAPATVASKDMIKGVSERSKGDLTKINSTANERVDKRQTPSSGRYVAPKNEKGDRNKPDANTVRRDGNMNTGPSGNAGSANTGKRQLPPQRVNSSRENRTNGSSAQGRTVSPSGQTHLEKMYNQNRTVNRANESRSREQSVNRQTRPPQPVQGNVKESRRENPGTTRMNEQKRSSEPSPAKKGNTGTSGRHGQ